MKRLRTIILSLSILFLVGGIGYRLGEQRIFSGSGPLHVQILKNIETPASASVDFSLFWDVWQRLHRYYVDAAHIDKQKLVWGAISGMVNALDDPYTIFLPPKENKEFKQDIGGSFEGIGAQLGEKENRIIVIAPLKGSPAESAGIKPYDWILKVDGEDTLGWTTQEAVNKIRGQKGTKVTLSILHDKEQNPEDIAIVRDEIIVPSVEWWVKLPKDVAELASATPSSLLASNKRIAYINLSRFGDRTNEEWGAAVEGIVDEEKKGNIQGLVFDLRSNPGGYLDGSVFIASEFLKSGIVVTQTDSDGTKQEYSVDRKGALYDIPLVVLVNKGSASAAEIVAGSLRDYNRARIVGETSFGKGSVQTPQELAGGAGIHITTGKWLLPKGDWIDKKGIVPDTLVTFDGSTASNDSQLAKAVEMLLK